MIKNRYLFFIILLSTVLFSCTSYKKNLYFQDLAEQQIASLKTDTAYQNVRVQKADILGLNASSRNIESTAVLNSSPKPVNGAATDSGAPVNGYVVDENGFIHLPLLGNVQVEGLTINQVSKLLTDKLATLYKDAIVNARIINFKVSVLGDVARPNVYTLQNDQANILDALALAGDLNSTASQKDLLLIRMEEGGFKYIHIDLTSRKFMSSPYFYLKNNDKIYVSPGRSKFSSINEGGFRAITLILSALSIAAILFARYK